MNNNSYRESTFGILWISPKTSTILLFQKEHHSMNIKIRFCTLKIKISKTVHTIDDKMLDIPDAEFSANFQWYYIETKRT